MLRNKKKEFMGKKKQNKKKDLLKLFDIEDLLKLVPPLFGSINLSLFFFFWARCKFKLLVEVNIFNPPTDVSNN